MIGKSRNDRYGFKYALKFIMLALCLSAALVTQGCAASDAVSDGKDFDTVMQAFKEDLFGTEQSNCQEISLNLPVRDGFEPIEDKSAYDSLDDPAMQEAYKNIEENLFIITDETDSTGHYIMKHTRLPSDLDSTEIYIVKEAVLADHPEAFWITGNYTIGYNFHDGNYITLYSEYSHEKISVAMAEINAAAQEILSEIPDGASEFERELIIHDALVDKVSYDSEAASEDNQSMDAFGIYGTLSLRKAVCSGYARSIKMLLNRVGIECRLVSGMSKNSGHMWNQVKIDGQWYNLDVTWDDPITNSDVQYGRYCYFNLTDEQLAADHETGRGFDEIRYESASDDGYITAELYNFDLEECTSSDANYYMMNAVYIASADSAGNNAITEKIKLLALTREQMFYIRFDDSISSDKAEKWLTGKSSALAKSMVESNNSGKGSKIKTCSLYRMASSDEAVWAHIYAVRIVYA